jgi:hypothetical protein
VAHLYWSAALTVTFLISLALIGKHNPWGWALGIADELLWTAYAIATRQWPFIISAVAYTAVCLWNLLAWRRSTPEDDRRPPQPGCLRPERSAPSFGGLGGSTRGAGGMVRGCGESEPSVWAPRSRRPGCPD